MKIFKKVNRVEGEKIQTDCIFIVGTTKCTTKTSYYFLINMRFIECNKSLMSPNTFEHSDTLASPKVFTTFSFKPFKCSYSIGWFSNNEF